MTLALHCHCSRCRRASGAAFTSIGRVPEAAFRVVKGQDFIAVYASSPGVERCFCKTCGSNLFSRRSDLGRVHVRLGTVDGDPGLRPSSHVHVASRAAWFSITDSLPQHDGPLPPR